MCKRLSIALNGMLTGDHGYPLCYTAYDRKSYWYRIFDWFIFWEKSHCRRTWLARRIHDRPKIILQYKRDNFTTDLEWEKALEYLEKVRSGPCLPGRTWVREERYHWSYKDKCYHDWVVKLIAVVDRRSEGTNESK